MILEHRPQRHAAAESWEVGEIADDAVGIIGWPGKREADGRRRLGTLLLDPGETLDEIRQATLQVIGVRGEGETGADRLAPADGGKAEAGSARIEGHHDPRIVSVAGHADLFGGGRHEGSAGAITVNA